MPEHSTLAQDTLSDARDLEGRLDDLYERTEGQDEGFVLFARDRVRQAIEELEKMDAAEVKHA